MGAAASVGARDPGGGVCAAAAAGEKAGEGERPPEAGGSPPPTPSSVRARREASAFFKYTTWMLPGEDDGWSSLAMSVRARFARAGLAERMSSELLLGS